MLLKDLKPKASDEALGFFRGYVEGVASNNIVQPPAEPGAAMVCEVFLFGRDGYQFFADRFDLLTR
jgi:hypothetical protein